MESGDDVYHGDSTAKCIFYFGEKQRFIELKQSTDHPLTSGYNVDSAKIYKITVAMLTDLTDVKSKSEFSLEYFSFEVSCCESEVIKVHFESIKLFYFFECDWYQITKKKLWMMLFWEILKSGL